MRQRFTGPPELPGAVRERPWSSVQWNERLQGLESLRAAARIEFRPSYLNLPGHTFNMARSVGCSSPRQIQRCGWGMCEVEDVTC